MDGGFDGGQALGRHAFRWEAEGGDFFVARAGPPEAESRPFLWAMEIPVGASDASRPALQTTTKPRFTEQKQHAIVYPCMEQQKAID